MVLRTAFATGGAVVVALPKKWREALKIYPKTSLVLTLKDRRITIERAIVTGAGVPEPDAALQEPADE